MNNPLSRNVTVGGITLIEISADTFAIPGGKLIAGRSNAIRAAKNMVAENSVLRAERNRGRKRA